MSPAKASSLTILDTSSVSSCLQSFGVSPTSSSRVIRAFLSAEKLGVHLPNGREGLAELMRYAAQQISGKCLQALQDQNVLILKSVVKERRDCEPT